MTSPILGEFLGTMMLVLLGNGVVAGVLLKRSKAWGLHRHRLREQ